MSTDQAFTYPSMLSEDRYQAIRNLVNKRFLSADGSYHLDLSVGFEKCICLDLDQNIVINDYDHPLDEQDHDYIIGHYPESTADEVVENYIQAVMEHHLDDANREAYRLQWLVDNSDILAWDD